jgi:heat shock protein HslJ
MLKVNRLIRVLILPGLALGLMACDESAVPVAGPTPPTQTVTPDPGGETSATSVTALHGAWQLVSLQEGDAPMTSIPEPERFTADFGADGALAARADCNRCQGSYEASSGTLAVHPLMACTLAYCQSAPLDTTYVSLLLSSTSWAVENAFLQLRSEKGVLRFER